MGSRKGISPPLRNGGFPRAEAALTAVEAGRGQAMADRVPAALYSSLGSLQDPSRQRWIPQSVMEEQGVLRRFLSCRRLKAPSGADSWGGSSAGVRPQG